MSFTSKTGKFGGFFNMNAGTIAPEASTFSANRKGWRKKKKSYLLLGFRCCWLE